MQFDVNTIKSIKFIFEIEFILFIKSIDFDTFIKSIIFHIVVVNISFFLCLIDMNRLKTFFTNDIDITFDMEIEPDMGTEYGGILIT